MSITNFVHAQTTWLHTSGQLRTGIPNGGFNGASANTGSLLFYNSTTANTLNIQSGATTTSYTLTLPLAQGAASTVLTNNGTGTLTWENAAGIGAWSLTGNSGTSASTNFIGTTDNVDWVVKTNNTEKMRVQSGGNVGIGTSTPNELLEVYHGNIRISNNNGGEGIKFTSDGAGNKSALYFINSSGTERFRMIHDRNGNGTDDIRFVSNNNSRDVLTLLQSGNVGIGTNAPSTLLELAADNTGVTENNVLRLTDKDAATAANQIAGKIEFYSTDNSPNSPGVVSYIDSKATGSGAAYNMHFGTGTSATVTDRMTIDNTGNVGIGTTTPTATLDINGTAKCTASAWSSDQQFKTDVNSIQNGLSIVKQLKPKSYYFDTTNVWGFKFPSEKQYGFIAQDLEQILPEIVTTSNKPEELDSAGTVVRPALTYKSVYYIELIALLTKGIQEQQQTIDSLNTKAIRQDSINTALNNQLSELSVKTDNQGEVNSLLQNQMNQLLDKINACCNAPTRSMQIDSDETQSQQTDIKLSDTQSLVLQQNVPNPFKEKTTINYVLPETYSKAELLFYNSQGKLIKSVELQGKGNGQLNVFADDLSNGVYSYTLVIDSKIVETKRMIKQ
jgi:hypothetical protein